jgi:hypothetical protein
MCPIAAFQFANQRVQISGVFFRNVSSKSASARDGNVHSTGYSRARLRDSIPANTYSKVPILEEFAQFLDISEVDINMPPILHTNFGDSSFLPTELDSRIFLGVRLFIQLWASLFKRSVRIPASQGRVRGGFGYR